MSIDTKASRAICEAAYASSGTSPPPWQVVNAQRFMHYRIIDADRREVISGEAAHPHGLLTFIAHARTTLPAALDRIEALEAENERLRDAVREWRNWADEVAPPFGMARDRSDEGQRAFIAAHIKTEACQRELDDALEAHSALIRNYGDVMHDRNEAIVARDAYRSMLDDIIRAGIRAALGDALWNRARRLLRNGPSHHTDDDKESAT